MNPEQRYQQDVSSGALLPDQAQANAMAGLQRVYEDLLARGRPAQKGWWRLFRRPAPPVRGLYLYGGVGRGKTYLMDTFFETLPFNDKIRTHFHRFMQGVHQQLAELRGRRNPLEEVAARIAARARVVCFDEFFVTDIGDAMILARLLEHLCQRGVVLVATSNIHPDRLYENGLQRERFLPAIELLHRHTRIVHLDSGVDYRLRELKQARLYHHPLGEAASRAMEDCFGRLAPVHAEEERNVELEVLGRTIRAKRIADDVAWFDFAELCGGPRSVHDYIELAREFHSVLLDSVPRMDERHDDRVRRFVNLVDEFYDRRVKLIIAAEVPMQALYSGRELAFVFERTVSRLLEMQSEDYLAAGHRA